MRNGARIEWWCFTAGAFGVRVMEIGVGISDGVEAKPKSRQLGGQRHGYGDASESEVVAKRRLQLDTPYGEKIFSGWVSPVTPHPASRLGQLPHSLALRW